MKQFLFIMMMILSSTVFGQSKVENLSYQEQKMIMQYRKHLETKNKVDTLSVFEQSQVEKLSSQEQKMITQYRAHLEAKKKADNLYDLVKEKKALKSFVEVENIGPIDELQSRYRASFNAGHIFLGISAATTALSFIPASKGNLEGTTALCVVSGLTFTTSMICYIVGACRKSDYIIALSQGRVYF